MKAICYQYSALWTTFHLFPSLASAIYAHDGKNPLYPYNRPPRGFPIGDVRHRQCTMQHVGWCFLPHCCQRVLHSPLRRPQPIRPGQGHRRQDGLKMDIGIPGSARPCRPGLDLLRFGRAVRSVLHRDRLGCLFVLWKVRIPATTGSVVLGEDDDASNKRCSSVTRTSWFSSRSDEDDENLAIGTGLCV